MTFVDSNIETDANNLTEIESKYISHIYI